MSSISGQSGYVWMQLAYRLVRQKVESPISALAPGVKMEDVGLWHQGIGNPKANVGITRHYGAREDVGN